MDTELFLEKNSAKINRKQTKKQKKMNCIFMKNNISLAVLVYVFNLWANWDLNTVFYTFI